MLYLESRPKWRNIGTTLSSQSACVYIRFCFVFFFRIAKEKKDDTNSSLYSNWNWKKQKHYAARQWWIEYFHFISFVRNVISRKPFEPGKHTHILHYTVHMTLISAVVAFCFYFSSHFIINFICTWCNETVQQQLRHSIVKPISFPCLFLSISTAMMTTTTTTLHQANVQ